MAAAEAERLKLEVRAEAVRAQRRAAESALEEVQLSCAAGQADLAALKRDLAGLEDKVRGSHLFLTTLSPGWLSPSLSDGLDAGKSVGVFACARDM